MEQVTVYQKSTCGTCKKATAYLDGKNVVYTSCDILTAPPTRELLEKHIDAANVPSFLNSRSALYRDRGMKNNPPDKKTAIDLMLQDPNLIKRPVIIKGRTVLFGFRDREVDALL